MNKRGLSGVIVTLITVLLSIVAVGIIWVVIANVIGDTSENVQKNSGMVVLDIKNNEISEIEGKAILTVKRLSGPGEMTGIKAFFETESGELIESEKALVIGEQQTVKVELDFTPTEEYIKSVTIYPQNTFEGETYSGQTGTSTEKKSPENLVKNPGFEEWSDCAISECPQEIDVAAVAVTGSVISGMATSGFDEVDLIDTDGLTVLNTYSTIQACANVVVAGQTCLVYPGTYPERITFGSGHSGTAENRVTFEVAESGTVEMYGFNTYGVDYLTIDGFNISIPESLIGDYYTLGAILIWSNNVNVINNYIHDTPKKAILGAPYQPYSRNILVKDNFIERIGMGIDITGINFTIKNNEIKFLTRTYDYVIDNDYIRYFGEDMVMSGNYLHGTVQGQHLCPSYWDYENDGYSSAVCSHIDCFQTFDDNNINAINAIIENNICIGYLHQGVMAGGGQGDFEPVTPSGNWTIRNNVFKYPGSFGVATMGIGDLTIVNNVFADMNSGVALGDSRDSADYVYISSGIVQNNIFYDAGANYAPDAVSTVDGGYNILNREGYPFYSEPEDLLNVDPLFVDPSDPVGPDGIPFTDDDGFRLCTGVDEPEVGCTGRSPAIDAGTDVGVTTDILGNLRDSQPDIGAYEYGDFETPAVCGDGVVDSGEECDNGASNNVVCSPACDSTCTYCTNICTDAVVTGLTCGGGGGTGGDTGDDEEEELPGEETCGQCPDSYEFWTADGQDKNIFKKESEVRSGKYSVKISDGINIAIRQNFSLGSDIEFSTEYVSTSWIRCPSSNGEDAEVKMSVNGFEDIASCDGSWHYLSVKWTSSNSGDYDSVIFGQLNEAGSWGGSYFYIDEATTYKSIA